MKMVVLVENSSRCRLCAEHGLSVYIEYEGKTYLLDTGATALFAENAKELGIDLSKVDTAFLSIIKALQLLWKYQKKFEII